MVVIFIFGSSLLSSLPMQQLAWVEDDSFSKEGRMIRIYGRKLHIHCLLLQRRRVTCKRWWFTCCNFSFMCGPTCDWDVHMVYTVGRFWKSIFISNKQSTFSTSEQGVMVNLVEAAQAVLWLRENCTRLLEFSTKMTFHTQLGGMFLVYISHVLLYMMQCWFENF